MRTRKRPMLIFNGVKDITDVDIARQNYYRLMQEQAVWNATKQQPKRSIFKLFNF